MKNIPTKDIAKKLVLNIFIYFKKNASLNEKDFAKLKNQFSKQFKIPNISNIELIQAYKNLVSEKKINENKKIETILSKRKIRSTSGVTVITCQTKQFPCPGKCIYCPSEPNMPKSYLSNQPASMRAVLNKFDPFNQVQNRLASLMVTGHNPTKCEIIIIGGTWSVLPLDYQENFIKNIYEALNQGVENQNIKKYGEFFKCPQIKKTEKSNTLEDALQKNTTAKNRCVGLTLETRPDYIIKEEIIRFRKYGCTRVELGVQTLDDQVQQKTKRGHTTKEVISATQLLRDAGFKIAYHLMPGLPYSSFEKDIEIVQKTFTDQNFKPDLVKFYPCVIPKFSKLETMYKNGQFKPLSEKELIPLLTQIKTLVPRYCRIIRLVRDIPSESIVAGCKTINLRQIIKKEMQENNLQCECIRCREIKAEKLDFANIQLKRKNYQASNGHEIFLTFDDTKKDKLISLLRLRIPSQYFSKKEHFIPELNKCALIREVHTYGQHTALGNKDGNTQHFGFGKKLIKKAEEIAKKEYNIKKIAVISGVGVREYYQKLGYVLQGTYMVKNI